MSRQRVIDIGNTAIKVGYFSGRELDQVKIISEFDLQTELQDEELPTLLSSVGRLNRPEVLDLKGLHILRSTTSLPIAIDYETPDTLGADRLANACATLGYADHKNFLVIDLGSCITYDLVVNGSFAGGAISPGSDMRFRAMNNFTAALPLTSLERSVPFPEKSTTGNLQAGVYHGILGEMEHMIDLTQSQYNDLAVILTGGNSALFAKALKSSIFADPNLTLRGLNEILLHLGV